MRVALYLVSTTLGLLTPLAVSEGLWPKSLSTRVACRIGRPRMARHLGRHAQAQTFGHRP